MTRQARQIFITPYNIHYIGTSCNEEDYMKIQVKSNTKSKCIQD